MFIRFAVMAVLLSLLLSSFSGCKKGPEVNEDGITLLEEPVVVADGSGARFKVLRPETMTDVISSCQSALINLSEGVTLTFAVAKEADNGNTDFEILLGNTCREESKEAMSAIGYDDFSVTYKNNKIIVAAHTPERLKEATAFLKEKILKSNEGRLEYIGNYTFKSTEALMIGEGESLSEYTIVCGDFDNLYGACTGLQKAIKERCGVELKVIFDTEAKSGKEIVVGNAKRDISALLDNVGMGEGLVAVKDGDLLIAAKEVTTAQELCDLFIKEYLSGAYTDSLNFKKAHSADVDVYAGIFKETNAVAAGSDMRVMSFNLLTDIWSDTPAVKGRDLGVAKTILYYTPDVIGLQEASNTWYKSLKSLLKATPYKLTCTEQERVDSKYGNNNFTAIMYNSETVTLIESGVKPFVSKGNQYMKTMTWAYFEHKESGKRFVLLNTHFEAPGSDEAEKAENLVYRKNQAVEYVAFVEELEARYNAPVIGTGDFNSTEGSDRADKHKPYATLVEKLHEAKYSAEKIQRQCSTWHTLGSQISIADAGSFDHIFGNDRVKFKYFNTLVDSFLMSASDHCPIYADLVLN